MRFLLSFASPALAVLVGCSGGSFALAEGADAETDTTSDGAAADGDATTDTAVDAATDTVDAATDVLPDVLPDVATDVVTDVLPDAPLCPAPTTTASFDASSMSCSDLLEKYPPYVADAKRCTCDADCRQKIGKDFCGCSTYVNPGREPYAALKSMRSQWEKLGCSVGCPALPCVEPTVAHCVAGAEGKFCKDG